VSPVVKRPKGKPKAAPPSPRSPMPDWLATVLLAVAGLSLIVAGALAMPELFPENKYTLIARTALGVFAPWVMLIGALFLGGAYSLWTRREPPAS